MMARVQYIQIPSLEVQEGVSINDKMLNKLLFSRILQKFIDFISIYDDPLKVTQPQCVHMFLTAQQLPSDCTVTALQMPGNCTATVQ